MKYLFFAVISVFFAPGALFCQSSEIVAGGSKGWEGWNLSGVGIDKQGGRNSLVLRSPERMGAAQDDLFLRFEEKNNSTLWVDYLPVRFSNDLYKNFSRSGRGSAGFEGRKGLVLEAGERSLFSPGQVWQDFSIEFWLYPELMSDGELVFQWTGACSQLGKILPQGVRAWFKGRKLAWKFENFFFQNRENTLPVVELVGLRPLLPRQWHHYLLRFNAAEGLLEYLVDGLPEASTYTTGRAKGNRQVFVPWVGALSPKSFSLCSSFTGFLEEFHLSGAFLEPGNQAPFPQGKGTAVSPVFDLGRSGSLLVTTVATTEKPSNTDLHFYYRMADERYYQWTTSGQNRVSLIPFVADEKDSDHEERENQSWIPFVPGSDNFVDKGKPRGRYVQFKIDFLPEGSGNFSPLLKSFEAKYLTQPLPPAPSYVEATPGNNEVTVRWLPVKLDSIKGYRLYLGTKSKQYTLAPVEMGLGEITEGKNLRAFRVTGLKNDQIYYLSVVTLLGEVSGLESKYSTEVAVRPVRIGMENP